jgi:hypothetical protein
MNRLSSFFQFGAHPARKLKQLRRLPQKRHHDRQKPNNTSSLTLAGKTAGQNSPELKPTFK